MDGLRDIFAIGIFQLESRIRQGDRLAGFSIHLDEFQAIADGFIVQDHAGRIIGIFGAANENVEGRFHGISFLGLGLPDGIDAVGQQHRLGLAVFIRGDGVTFKSAGGIKGTGLFQIYLEHSARFRRFDQARVVVDFVVAREFHKGITAIKNFVADNTLIGDNRFLGLPRRAGGIHEDMLVRGLIAGRRRQLHDLIHAGPEFFRRDGRILASRFQAFHDYSALFIQDIALPIHDVLTG